MLTAKEVKAQARAKLAQREQARRNPDVFVAYTRGYQQGQFHRRIQAHLTAHEKAYCELPRGHGKTEQAAARMAWEIGRNPAIRIKYIAQTDEYATKTTDLVKRIIESPAYSRVFPAVRPDPTLWGKQAMRVLSPALTRDATLEASGIFGHAGGRWDLLIGDDVCDLQNSIQKPALRLPAVPPMLEQTVCRQAPQL